MRRAQSRAGVSSASACSSNMRISLRELGGGRCSELENLLAVVSKQFCTRRCRQQKARKSVHVDGRPYGLRALPPRLDSVQCHARQWLAAAERLVHTGQKIAFKAHSGLEASSSRTSVHWLTSFPACRTTLQSTDLVCCKRPTRTRRRRQAEVHSLAVQPCGRPW